MASYSLRSKLLLNYRITIQIQRYNITKTPIKSFISRQTAFNYGKIHQKILKTNIRIFQNEIFVCRKFQTSNRRFIVPPALWIFVKPVAKVLTMITGR
jgi:hypothetical protein